MVDWHDRSNAETAAQQVAAPDRLQLHSSFLLAPLPAADELVVVPSRAALRDVDELIT